MFPCFINFSFVIQTTQIEFDFFFLVLKITQLNSQLKKKDYQIVLN